MIEKPLQAYFGHHKCATVWIHGILTEICRQLPLKIEYVHSAKQFNHDLDAFIRDNHIDFLTYANADIDYVSRLKTYRGFHVIRDPRDIAVSSYFSHLHSHPTSDWKALTLHREKLKQVPKARGMFLDIEFIHQDVFKRLEKWDYHNHDIMEIKMEELTRNPDNIFQEILDFLGIPGKKLSRRKLGKILKKKRFSILSGGRKPGQEDEKKHFRKGIAGDWANHFNEDHKKYFKEKYNHLLVQLGYEKDDRW